MDQPVVPLAGERVVLREAPRYPALYQINTRVLLTALSRSLGRAATLDDIPDSELDRVAAAGFDWVWFLSVWQTGAAGRRVSRENADWRRSFEQALPDLGDEDIAGSGFAITGYTTHAVLGGDAALARLRERLRKRGLRLMLDFVPNHTALDHPWLDAHPEYYVPGSEGDLARAPQNYTRAKCAGNEWVLAHGRDPYFPGWPDTLQLNYARPETQDAMIGELSKVADRCDGVRCDMAMLILPDVFEGTWGLRPEAFWPKAIECVRDRFPGFVFMAEVYWDLEWTLQQQGFSYTYDKRLYDRLREGHARPVRDHLRADFEYQRRMARFMENHDEPRAAATFPGPMHEAAAVLTYLSPGLRFFQHGQFEGCRTHVSPHLVRAPIEACDPAVAQFYERLTSVLRQQVVRNGEWTLLECVPAWDGNWTWDCFIAFLWSDSEGVHRLVAVNYAGNQSQCCVRLPVQDLNGRTLRFKDLMSTAVYERGGADLYARGLYLDLPAWGYHVFEVQCT
jgi:glycosidase